MGSSSDKPSGKLTLLLRILSERFGPRPPPGSEQPPGPLVNATTSQDTGRGVGHAARSLATPLGRALGLLPAARVTALGAVRPARGGSARPPG